MVSNQNLPTVLVNGISTSMFGHPQCLTIELRRLSIEELRELLQGNVVSFIRHQSTVQVLSQLAQRQIEINNGIYMYRGERIVLVVLQVPQRGQETSVKLEDLTFYEVVVKQLE